ncbi:MAG: aspartate aminotransferase family protein [Candidatus Sulfotelmatobacter sp.]
MKKDAHVYSTGNSKRFYERTKEVLIEGGSSSSRGPANYGEYPIFMQRGAGSRLYDVDGNEYIDWMMGFGALPLGHADPQVAQAITEAASTGAHFATATEIEVEVAEMLQKMIGNAEIVRFANTGTEAVMAAIRLARGFTGRPKIVKFEGHYHGWYDDLCVSSNVVPTTTMGVKSDPVRIPDSSGLNRYALEDTVVVSWNDLTELERALENNHGQIAAIITEGIMANMGVIPPAEGYLLGVQELARKHGALFILDETVTGFRIAPGGCQEYYKLSPDIATFGKALGCGLPVAAFVGRREVMSKLEWGGVLHYGTHNASRIGMHAARASLRKLSREDNAGFRYMWTIADELCAGIAQIFKQRHVPAIVQRVGPMFQIMFTKASGIHDAREFCSLVDRTAYQKLSHKLFEFGVYTSPAAGLHSIATFAHTKDDVEFTLNAIDKALGALEE